MKHSTYLQWQNALLSKLILELIEDKYADKKDKAGKYRTDFIGKELGLKGEDVKAIVAKTGIGNKRLRAETIESLFERLKKYIVEELKGKSIPDQINVWKQNYNSNMQQALNMNDELFAKYSSMDESGNMFFRLKYLAETKSKSIDSSLQKKEKQGKAKKKQQSTTKQLSKISKHPKQISPEKSEVKLQFKSKSEPVTIPEIPEKSALTYKVPINVNITLPEEMLDTLKSQLQDHTTQVLEMEIPKLFQNEQLSYLTKIAEIVTQLKDPFYDVLSDIPKDEQVDEHSLATLLAFKVMEVLSALPQIERDGKMLSVLFVSPKEVMKMIPPPVPKADDKISGKIPEQEKAAAKVLIHKLNSYLSKFVRYEDSEELTMLRKLLEGDINTFYHLLTCVKYPFDLKAAELKKNELKNMNLFFNKQKKEK